MGIVVNLEIIENTGNVQFIYVNMTCSIRDVRILVFMRCSGKVSVFAYVQSARK